MEGNMSWRFARRGEVTEVVPRDMDFLKGRGRDRMGRWKLGVAWTEGADATRVLVARSVHDFADAFPPLAKGGKGGWGRTAREA